MNYPFESQQSSNKSEILISYSRQELKNLDFDPTKPEIYQKQQQQNNNSNKIIQSNNPPQGPPYPQQQFQDSILKIEKKQYDNSSVLKYQTQEEYHKSFLNNFNNIPYQNNQPQNQNYTSSFLHTYNQQYKEGQ